MTALVETEARVKDFRVLTPGSAPRRTFVTQQELAQRIIADSTAPGSAENAANQEALYRILGLIPADYDYLAGETEFLGSQIAGLYFHETDEILVVRDSVDDGTLSINEEFIYAHEYTHFLQDVVLDSTRLYSSLGSSDESQAVRALIEGDATLASVLHIWNRQQPGLKLSADLIDDVFEFDPKTIDPEVPYFLQRYFQFAYSDGTAFVARLHRSGLPTPPPTAIRDISRGGFPAINRAYTETPATTEQVIHFEKYQAHEAALNVSIPDLSGTLGPGWSSVYYDVLGEFFLRTWLEALKTPSPGVGAAGWNGDRFTFWRGPSSQFVFVASIHWDTAVPDADGLEFANELRGGLAKDPDFSSVGTGIETPAGIQSVVFDGPLGFLVVARSTADGTVYVVGGPTLAIAEDVLAAVMAPGATPPPTTKTPTPTPTATPPPASMRVAMFGFEVIDAEYSKELDKIIMVSAHPNRLHVYDPVANSDTAVNLPLPPGAVSVSPDGLRAAVGHDGWISYVDLTSASLIKAVPVSADVLDIVLAGNNYAYVFPKRDQWEPIRSVNLNTAQETQGPGNAIYAGTVAQLHPDGQTIYGANSLSPSDLFRYSIKNGTATVLYDSPYHGQHDICGRLWMSEDGLRIFTACGNVFRSSASPSEDMVHNGSLSGITGTWIRHLTHSQALAKVFVVPGGGGQNSNRKLYIYGYNNLGFEKGVDLPEFVVNGKSYASYGRYAFVNSDGSRIFVTVQPDAGSGLSGHAVIALETRELLAPGPVSLHAYKPTPAPTPAPSPTSSPPDTKSLSLVFRILDAEYSKHLDRIIAVSTGPNQLHVYNPLAGDDLAVALPNTPSSVSVSPDGRYAAVGHDGSISYVDLVSASLVKTLPVSADVTDVVLAGNGYVYAFPGKEPGWVPVRSIHVATGVETPSSFLLYPGTVAKLHPDGEAIYSAYPSGISPSGMDKHSIKNGPVEALHDFPHQGENEVCGDLWMAEDGLRVFTKCGNVVRASSVHSQDMLYSGSLSEMFGGRVKHLTHSDVLGTVFAIPDAQYDRGPTLTPQLQIYDDEFLAYEGAIGLPRFTVNGKSYPGHGRFVFVNRDGSKVYVVLQADLASGLLLDFAVLTIDAQHIK